MPQRGRKYHRERLTWPERVLPARGPGGGCARPKPEPRNTEPPNIFGGFNFFRFFRSAGFGVQGTNFCRYILSALPFFP
jgi:hypothetical protein